MTVTSRQNPIGLPRQTGDKLYHVAAAVTVRSYVTAFSDSDAESRLMAEIQKRLGPIDTQGSVDIAVVAAAQAMDSAR